MIETQPKIYLIAEPMIGIDEMRRYLTEVGGENWLDEVMDSQPPHHSPRHRDAYFGGR